MANPKLRAPKEKGGDESLDIERSRASVACVTCRRRRTKCKITQGEYACQYCRSIGSQCVFKASEEKKRIGSSAYMEVLDRRLENLEILLRGWQPAASQNHLVPTVDEADCASSSRSEESQHGSPLRHLSHQNSGAILSISCNSRNEEEKDAQHSAPASIEDNRSVHGKVNNLLSTAGQLRFYKGSWRYFGATTNLHVFHDEEDDLVTPASQAVEQKATRMISLLSLDTHNYLLNLFWNCYNAIIEVVPQTPFLEGYRRGPSEHYSIFLHIAILAMGVRFADKSRSDISVLMISKYESTFQVMAKQLFEPAIKVGGLASLQASLLMTDLENGSGKDVLAWLYGGRMTCRLFFDLGLNLDSISLGVLDKGVEVRRKVALASLIMDKYEFWALFLGRPTSIKSADLETLSLARSFAMLPQKHNEIAIATNGLINEHLSELMDIVGSIADSNARRTRDVDSSTYATMAFLEGQLSRWHADLPACLLWNPTNVRVASRSFFIMHQQYHSALVLLYRPFVNSKSVRALGTRHDPLSLLLEHGVCIAQAFVQSAHQYNIQQSFISSLQHAGTAISAFITTLVYLEDRKKRYSAMRYLLFMSTMLEELSHTYQHALHMHRLVLEVSQQREWINEYQSLDAEFNQDFEDLRHFTVKLGSPTSENTQPGPMNKRRKLNSPNLSGVDDGTIDDSTNSNTFCTTWATASSRVSHVQRLSGSAGQESLKPARESCSPDERCDKNGKTSECFLAESFDISTEDWENLPILPLPVDTRGYDFSFEYPTS
ncbi:uncharacterized protein PV06_11032 [Exophiala oligosperma]|uniref:Zn(2)-C6 fungal-type domain-containing protein n=1 Tax=Exophiala oligosperma TaxID=215243 RepID=A0A0D2A8T5_9EURO|nr:uncharacterized protein PV06_11032 [Exophiala oligosperma]KIW36736.1 hypothetical protein PV06_11032 [Exophiala oligosperma]